MIGLGLRECLGAFDFFVFIDDNFDDLIPFPFAIHFEIPFVVVYFFDLDLYSGV